jgi:site-specific DNA recombinase
MYSRTTIATNHPSGIASIREQERAMRAFIAQRKSSGWTCRRKTYRDIGHSAGTLKRPALSRLRADLRAGKLDCVVVYSFDRLTRSLADQATLLAECCASGAMLVGVCPAFLYVRGMEATLCLSDESAPRSRPSSNRQPKGAKA